MSSQNKKNKTKRGCGGGGETVGSRGAWTRPGWKPSMAGRGWGGGGASGTDPGGVAAGHPGFGDGPRGPIGPAVAAAGHPGSGRGMLAFPARLLAGG